MTKTILALALLAGAYANAWTVEYQPGSTPVRKKVCFRTQDHSDAVTCRWKDVYYTAPQTRNVCRYPNREEQAMGQTVTCSDKYGRFQDNGQIVFEDQAECVSFYKRTMYKGKDKHGFSSSDIKRMISEKCGN